MPKLMKLIELYNKFKTNFPELNEALIAVLTKLLFPVSEPVFSASGDNPAALAQFEEECKAILAD